MECELFPLDVVLKADLKTPCPIMVKVESLLWGANYQFFSGGFGGGLLEVGGVFAVS